MTTLKSIRGVLCISIVAMTALYIEPVHADPISVPNGEFNIYKPGTGYTISATFSADAYAAGIGDNLILSRGTVEYSDETTSNVVDCPGWVSIHGRKNDLMGNGVDGSSAFNAFAAWGGDIRIQSANSLGPIAGSSTYTLSAMVKGPVAAGPLAFYLLVDGVALTPSSSVEPVDPFVDFQLIIRTFDSTNIYTHIG